jgi:histidinol-phosphate phosphatase family protein
VSKFILLDRDGVINQRPPGGYVTSWADFRFLDGSLEGLRLLAESNYAPVVVSNQACVGKGLLTSCELEVITRRFVAEVERNGGRICGVYYCTHREEDGCECRKPKPGLIVQAQKEHGFDFQDTLFVGDSETDLLAAHNAGCPSILISDSKGLDFARIGCSPRAVVSSFLEATRLIVSLLPAK